MKKCLLTKLRPIVYKMGFRPKRYTILYSPSLAWILTVQEAHEAINSPQE